MESRHIRDSVWEFGLADELDYHQWSYGSVVTLADLYSPRIFGAVEDLQCGCGRLSGTETVGRLCTRCGVRVVASAAAERRRRLGKVELAVPCRHPLSPEVSILEFPIAPIHFRSKTATERTLLGKRYEDLVSVNDRLKRELPEIGSAEYFKTIAPEMSEPLNAALTAVVGSRENGGTIEQGTLLYFIIDSIFSLSSDLCTLARACGIIVRVSASV
jgi:hypothetical protein